MRMHFLIFILFVSSGLYSQPQEIQDTSTYVLKAKLIKAETLSPHCGTIAWALAQKFEIVESNFEPIKSGFTVILIQPCPEFLGPHYFAKNRIYNVIASKTSDATFGFAVINLYEKENLLSFWIRDIKLSFQNGSEP